MASQLWQPLVAPTSVGDNLSSQDHGGGPDAAHPSNRAQPPRKRKSNPKVRTGCTTCKIRKVKCDETKPSCHRCTSTGRKCDGYAFIRGPPSQGQLILPSSISVNLPGDVVERRIFHRFQTRTIPAFAGASEGGFWEGLVLRVGHQEPVVRNAIIALTTLHEDYQERRGKYSQDLIRHPRHQHAVHLYIKAFRQLRERLNESSATTAKLAIISSILFACFEVLRRDGMAAIMHYQAGMRELSRQIRFNRERQAAPSTAVAQPASLTMTEFRPSPEDDLDVLLRVMARYDVQACTFAAPRVQALAVTLPQQPPTFMTIAQVKMHLDNLLISIYQLIKSDSRMYRYWKSDAVPADWLLRRDEAIATFESWVRAIDRFFRNFHNSNLAIQPYEMKTLLGLRMQVKVALILLKTCIDSAPESCFDAFLAEFDDIVARIEHLEDSLSLREALPLEDESVPFTMELGILHPLFFVATKCRDYAVRRRAVGALRRGGREGIWEGPVVAVVAERMIEIEEEGVLPGQFVPEANRIHEIGKLVDYDGRQVRIEAKRSVDQVDWKIWEVIRESIKF